MESRDYPYDLQYTNDQIGATDDLHRTFHATHEAYKLMKFLQERFGWSDVHAAMIAYRKEYLPVLQKEHEKSVENWRDCGAEEINWKRLNFE